MKRIQLRSKEVNSWIKSYGVEISKKDQAELLEREFKVILVNKISAFFYYDEKIIPTLKFLQNHPTILKQVVVDMGAVKFMVSGADVMRSGIVEIAPEISKDDFVVIVDVNNKKPLAVGIALYSSEEMKEIKTGKVIRNIHFVGDELWKLQV